MAGVALTGRWRFTPLAAWALLACADGSPGPDAAELSEPKRPRLCERAGDDPVRDVFCAQAQPSVRSLAELQRSLGLSDAQEPAEYAFLAHSTALSGQLVSPINPRMIALTRDVQLAFTRGVQHVELATRDRSSQRIKLYLLHFEQACNTAADGCRPGTLYTPNIERDWTRVALQDDEELKNTASDCRQCHQRGLTEPILLMRELEGPWTHFFAPEMAETSFPEPTGSDLFEDYVRAKGEEAYGGVPASLMRSSSGFALQAAVSSSQPLIFEGAIIANERWPYRPQGYALEAQRSPTWDEQYAAFKRGEHLALPYYAARASDPEKQAQLTAAYRGFQAGELSSDELPDLSNIHPEDAQARAEVGLQSEPDGTPVELLIQSCGPCHNDILDQTISRARFNIALGGLDDTERQLAAKRIELPADAAGAMPPAGARQLDEDGRMRLLDYLRQATRPDEDEAQLAHAASLGMALAPEERTQ